MAIGGLALLFGGGGSILLLPLLVSGAGLPSREAVPLSLLVVMLLAALILGLPALVGSWIGGSWVKAGAVPESVQLAVFTAAAVLASWLLTRQPAPPGSGVPRGEGGAHRHRRTQQLAFQGLLIGLLTGIAGVGGGFAIVPALVLLAELPMPLASGTSLLLIAANALVAFLALGHWPGSSLPLMLPLLLGGAAGALLLGSALLTGLEAVTGFRTMDAPAFPGACTPSRHVLPPCPPARRPGPVGG